MNPYGSDVIIQNDSRNQQVEIFSINNIDDLNFKDLTSKISNALNPINIYPKADVIILDFCFDHEYKKTSKKRRLESRITCILNYLNTVIGKVTCKFEILIRGMWVSQLSMLALLSPEINIRCKSYAQPPIDEILKFPFIIID